MYKRAYRDDYLPGINDPDRAGPGDDAPVFIGKITALFPSLTPKIVNQLFKISYAPFDNVWGTCGEIFYNTDTRGKVASAAIGIPLNYVSQVHDILMDLNNQQGPFAGVFSYRYVKATEATLGFTAFDHTCVAELDGVLSTATNKFYDKVWRELDNHTIPYTFHWGKLNNMNGTVIRKMYGQNVNKWIDARNTLLPPSSVEVFNNEILNLWELDTVIT